MMRLHFPVPFSVHVVASLFYPVPCVLRHYPQQTIRFLGARATTVVRKLRYSTLNVFVFKD